MDRPSGAAAELARALARTTIDDPPLREFFARVAQMFAQTMGGHQVTFAILEDGELHAEFAGSSPHGAQMQSLLDSSYARKAVDEQRVIASPELPDGQAQLALPLLGKDAVTGLLTALVDARIAAQCDLDTLGTAALNVSAYIARARKEMEIAGLADLALTDPLTGIANRRHFDKRLHDEWSRASRGQYALALVFVDVDFFGMYNTKYGHPAGDDCLRNIAGALCAAVVRESDMIARYGGEEFVAILPATDLAGAVVVAERMRTAVESLEMHHDATRLRRVTISLGAAVRTPQPYEHAEALVEMADAMLLRAKGLGRNRLVCEGYESNAAANERRYEHSHTLPNDITRFVGRETELQQITQLLREKRLLTLVGPDGVGKTRIACEAARRLADRYPDGVRFVDLSSVTHPEGLPSFIAHALGIGGDSGKPQLQMVTERLAAREQLLIFDNCEHVITACAEAIEQILTECARIRVLSTARQSLEIPGETLFQLQPLSANDARDFFLERLQAGAANALSTTDTQAVATICDRLDRLPFALELVAPRVSSIGIEGMLSMLEDSSFVLSTSLHRTRARQQTVANLLEWSYRLLPAKEQSLLRRLSVLGGSFDECLGQAICADEQTSTEAWQTALAELVRKSLLVHDAASKRYRLLELTRQFVAERLRECGEDRLFRLRHANEMLERSAALHEDAHCGHFTRAKQAMDEDWPNFSAALHNTLIDSDDPATGAQIAANLAYYWVSSGPAEEATHWLNLAAAYEDELQTGALAMLLLARAMLAQVRMDHEAVHRFASDAAVLFEELGDRINLGVAQGLCATADLAMGNYVQAQALNAASLQNAEATGDQRSIAVALVNIGVVAAEWQHDFAAASEVYERAISILCVMDAPSSLAKALTELAEVRFAQGRIDLAIPLADQARATLHGIGDNYAGYAASLLASFHIALGAAAPARRALSDALDSYEEFRGSRWIAHCIEQCAKMAQNDGDRRTAANLNGFVDSYCQEAEFAFSPSAEAEMLAFRRCVRETLTMNNYQAFYSEGASWPVPKAFDVARRIVSDSVLAA